MPYRGIRASRDVRRRALLWTPVLLIVAALLTVLFASAGRVRRAATTWAGPSPDDVMAADLADRFAAHQVEFRALWLQTATYRLQSIGSVVAIASLSGVHPDGPREFAALVKSLPPEFESVRDPGIDAAVAFRDLPPDRSEAPPWTALVRMDAAADAPFAFDRVLRLPGDLVFVGWTAERGVDATTMPLTPLPDEAAEFVAATTSGDVHWCSIEAYRREFSYDPDAPAVWDDPVALQALWEEAFALAGADATVRESGAGIPPLVVADADAVEPSARGLTLMLAYGTLARDVHVYPRCVRRASAVSGIDLVADEDMFRVFLVHEAVHAHDSATSPALQAAPLSGDPGRVRVAELLLEGHADLVAERVARSTGHADAWERFARLDRRGAVVGDGARPDTGREIYRTGREILVGALAAGGAPAVRGLIARPPATEAELLAQWPSAPDDRPTR